MPIINQHRFNSPIHTGLWVAFVHQFRLGLNVNLLEAAKGEISSGPDPPLEVVSGLYYWRTEPVLMVLLQVVVSTSQEHTVWTIKFLKTEISWLNDSGLVCCCLVEEKTCSHTSPLWNSLDMPALKLQCCVCVPWIFRGKGSQIIHSFIQNVCSCWTVVLFLKDNWHVCVPWSFRANR